MPLIIFRQNIKERNKMKIRQGFVSNSSSTSFVIAIEIPPKTCPHCKSKCFSALDFFQYKYKNQSLTTSIRCTTIKDFKIEKKEEISHLKEKINWMKKELKIYTQAQEDKNNREILARLILSMKELDKNTPISKDEYMKLPRFCQWQEQSAEDYLAYLIHLCDNDIQKIQEYVDSIQSMLDKIKNVKGNWIITELKNVDNFYEKSEVEEICNISKSIILSKISI